MDENLRRYMVVYHSKSNFLIGVCVSSDSIESAVNSINGKNVSGLEYHLNESSIAFILEDVNEKLYEQAVKSKETFLREITSADYKTEYAQSQPLRYFKNMMKMARDSKMPAFIRDISGKAYEYLAKKCYSSTEEGKQTIHIVTKLAK